MISNSEILIQRFLGLTGTIYFAGFNVNNVPTRGMRRMDFLQTIENFAEDENHGDIMVLAVMSHSSEEHTGIKILTSDYEELDLETDIVR